MSVSIIACTESPFGIFTEAWRFATSPTGGTHLTSTTDYTIKSPLMRRMMGGAYEELHHAAMRGFAVRALAFVWQGRPGGFAPWTPTKDKSLEPLK